MTEPDLSDAPPPEFLQVYHEAIQRILDDEPLASFCDWFVGELASVLPPPTPDQADDDARRLRHQARALWHAVPVPQNRWRPRPQPKLERNGPCPCGSGRKYKQCCASFAQDALPLPPELLFSVALSMAEPRMLTPALARQVPPEALGDVAATWNSRDMPGRTVAVLEPLFERAEGLDDRHTLGFDALMDAYQAFGLETSRHTLVRRMATARDPTLATAARCRWISMLADGGDARAAWALFHETQRLYPEMPELWHLELTLLHGEGRADEARRRGPVLVAQARRAGLGELANVLEALAVHGIDDALDWAGEDDAVEDVEDEAWVALCEQVPAAIDAPACLALHERTLEAPESEGEPPLLHVRSTGTLAGLVSDWRARFKVDKPVQTTLVGDAGALLEDLPAAAAFLAEHPQAWLSLDVLDDLLLAAAEIADPDAPAPVLRAAWRLAEHGVAVLRIVIGEEPVRLLWMNTASRPALRVLAQAIHLARERRDNAQIEELIRWSLQLNPHDNHGWRTVLAPALLMHRRAAEALALTQAYPDDMPPMAHLRALALFMLDQRDEAEAALRAAHADSPRLVQALLPDLLDAPPDDDGPGIEPGGVVQAWEHRALMRPTWVRSGALDWLRGLNL